MRPPKKHDDLFRYRLDLNDGQTSFIEKVLLWIGVGCMLIGTASEVIQAVQALQTMRW